MDERHRLERSGRTIHTTRYPSHNMDFECYPNTVHGPSTEASSGELHMLHVVRHRPRSAEPLRKMETPANGIENTAVVGCRVPRRSTEMEQELQRKRLHGQEPCNGAL